MRWPEIALMLLGTVVVLFLGWRQVKIEREFRSLRGRSPSVTWTSSVSTDRPVPHSTLSIGLTPELAEILGHIKRVTGEPLEEIVVKSIALYRLSVDAHKEGKRIGVLDHDFGFEREVVGFDEHGSP